MSYSGFRNFQRFCTHCVACGGTTSKAYARTHDGKCKGCTSSTVLADGSMDLSQHPLKCPDCNGLRTPYQKKHGYHCDACTRETDPEGWALEMSTPQEPPDYADRY